MYYLFREELANIKKHISGLLPFLKKIPLTAVREKGSKGKSRVTHCRLQQATVEAWPHHVPALLAFFPFIPSAGCTHSCHRTFA